MSENVVEGKSLDEECEDAWVQGEEIMQSYLNPAKVVLKRTIVGVASSTHAGKLISVALKLDDGTMLTFGGDEIRVGCRKAEKAETRPGPRRNEGQKV